MKRSSGLKRTSSLGGRRGVSPASPAQREKVHAGWCIVTGQTQTPGLLPVDPAHLWPRGRGGCDHPDCVVPLRRDVHMQFDDGELDLLPYLIAQKCWVEIAHMISAHEVDPISLLRRLTGERWAPESGHEEAA